MDRCQVLAERLPKAQVIHGDSTDRQILQEEGLPNAEAFVCATGIDEENIMLALYAARVSGAKVITKISRIDFEEVVEDLNLGSVVYPKNITAETIVRYVRAMKNTIGSNVETLYNIIKGKVDAAEFIIREKSPVAGKPLMEMKLRIGVWVATASAIPELPLSTARVIIRTVLWMRPPHLVFCASSMLPVSPTSPDFCGSGSFAPSTASNCSAAPSRSPCACRARPSR